MPTFRYKAYSATGSSTSGTVEADSERQAMQQLKGKGLLPREVVELTGRRNTSDWQGDASVRTRRLPFVRDIPHNAIRFQNDRELIVFVHVVFMAHNRADPHAMIRLAVGSDEHVDPSGEYAFRALRPVFAPLDNGVRREGARPLIEIELHAPLARWPDEKRNVGSCA